MSGHSKWHNIQKTKGAQDAKRAAAFTKIAKELIVAVKEGGIDVDDVDCVVNFDIPEENEYYVHRIGRTGRAKRKGVAWSIVGNFPEKAKLDEICKFCGFSIKPMVLGDDGSLTEEVVKPTPPPKRRFR